MKNWRYCSLLCSEFFFFNSTNFIKFPEFFKFIKPWSSWEFFNFVKLPDAYASGSFSCDRILLRSLFSMSRILVLSSFTIFGCSALKVLNLESAEGNLFELQYDEVWCLRKLFIKLKYKSDIFLNCWENVQYCLTCFINITFKSSSWVYYKCDDCNYPVLSKLYCLP